MSNIENFFEEIKKAEIFSGLENNALREILNAAQINFCENGKMIFLANQMATNLYLIVRGAVKTFLNDEDGVEAVIEIIDDKQIIEDVFSHSHRANCQAISDAIILQIPLKILQNFIKNNAHLSYNFLQERSKRNAALSKQIESLKTNDAKEKLGNFILGMSFKKDKKSQNVKIDFNKSVIASYLNLKPETLSRNLKKLEDDGEIIVSGNEIHLTNKKSLCHYCSSDIATKCGDFKGDIFRNEEFANLDCKHKN